MRRIHANVYLGSSLSHRHARRHTAGVSLESLLMAQPGQGRACRGIGGLAAFSVEIALHPAAAAVAHHMGAAAVTARQCMGELDDCQAGALDLSRGHNLLKLAELLDRR